MRLYLLLIAFSFAASYLLTPMVRSAGHRFAAKQEVRERDMHDTPIVKFGGVAIVLSFLLGLWLASRFGFFSGVFGNTQAITGLCLALAGVVVLGLLDDLFDLRWFIKFGGQVIIALMLPLHGIVVQAMPVGSWQIRETWMQVGVTVFLVVLTMNAINFSDGLDGLAAGLASIGAATFFLYSYVLATHVRAEDYANFGALLCALLLGACLGFLPHNFNPANIFMGETGVLAIGLVLSAAAIAVTGDVQGLEARRFRNIPAFMPVVLPAVIMALPFLDLVLSVVRRVSKGRSPFSADSGHLHHKMLSQGHSVRRAVVLLYLWALVIAVVVVLFAFIPPNFVWPVLVVLFVGVAALTWQPLVVSWCKTLVKLVRKIRSRA